MPSCPQENWRLDSVRLFETLEELFKITVASMKVSRVHFSVFKMEAFGADTARKISPGQVKD